MKFKIKCTKNINKNPNYFISFSWNEKIIELDYNYSSDECYVNVDSQSYDDIEGNDKNLDSIVGVLATFMTGLEFEDMKPGEELELDSENW